METAAAVEFVRQVANWAQAEEGVVGVALVGSYARGEARPDSDLDFVIIATDPSSYTDDPSWINSFGEAASCRTEDWGILTSLRVFYQAGQEVEFGISSLAWAAIPPDSGTARVVADGMRVLYDPHGRLARLQAEVAGKGSS